MGKEKKLNAVLTFEVEGDEQFNVRVEYKGTTLETVKMVESVIGKALLGLNEE